MKMSDIGKVLRLTREHEHIRRGRWRLGAQPASSHCRPDAELEVALEAFRQRCLDRIEVELRALGVEVPKRARPPVRLIDMGGPRDPLRVLA